MKSFSAYLAEAAKNTHMTHIEDSVIYGGVKGARESINALRELRDMLAGHRGPPLVFAASTPPGTT